MPTSLTYVHTPSRGALETWPCVFKAGMLRCDTEYHIYRSRHVGYHLFYVRRGRLLGRLGDQRFVVEAGQVCLMDLGLPHEYGADPDDPPEMLWVRMAGPTMAGLFRAADAAERPVCAGPKSLADHVEAGLRQVLRLLRDRPVSLEAEAGRILHDLLMHIVTFRMEERAREAESRGPSESEARRSDVQPAIRRLEFRYYEATTVEELASLCHMSPYHFCRQFKKCTGYTPIEYLHACRLNAAKRLLERSDTSVTAVGQQVGYPDPSYFIRRFKRDEGLTPGQFRLACEPTFS